MFWRALGWFNRVRPWARKLGKAFQSTSSLLLALLLAIVLAAIWWLGPLIPLSGGHPLAPTQTRLLVCLGLVLVVALWWGQRQAKKVRAMADERAHESHLKDDPIAADIEHQEEVLEHMQGELKAHLGSQEYLYKLPWYLVMGVENAGKTSLVNRSGQRFSLTHVMKAQSQADQGRYGFDWWVSDQAVLIDPDGELLTQRALQGDTPGELERRLWTHFLGWLERTRSRRPLNGVVLVVDLAQLSHARVSVRKAYAHLLRARIQELMDTLSTRLPIYVTFSKIDLLHGFDTFFRHYSRQERREPLGFTFTPETIRQSDAWQREFVDGFDGMVEHLNARLPGMLADCRDDAEREALFCFMRQMAGLKDVLSDFLSETLGSDRYSTDAMVRGTYFTSVYQQGVPEDPFVDAAARRYGMRERVQAAHRAARSGLYFTEDLFTRIIYPESGLAGDNGRVRRDRERALWLAAVTCCVGGAVLLGGWWHFYQKNAYAADVVENSAQQFVENRPVTTDGSDPSGHALLPALDELRQATNAFGDYRDHVPLVSELGLYQGRRIGPAAEKAYVDMLEYRFLPALMIGVTDAMNRAPADSEEKMKQLRILRMLSDASGRRDAMVKTYMAQAWQNRFPGRADVQNRLMAHLDYALDHTDLVGDQRRGDSKADVAMSTFGRSIQAAQAELGDEPIANRVYASLKAQSESQLPAPLDLRSTIGTSFSVVFDSDAESRSAYRIPRMLTDRGFENYFLGRLDDATELALIDTWALGRRDDTDFSQQDRERLRNQLRDAYAADYSNTWETALDSLEIAHFDDIDQAVLVLDTLTGSGQPLTRLLATVQDNTELYPELPTDDQAAREALKKTTRYQLASQIDRRFASINDLNGSDDSRQNANIDDVRKAIDNLRGYMRKIADDSDQDRAAFRAAKARLSLSDADPIFTLHRIAGDAPQPLGDMLNSLADQSWKVVLNAALKHLEHSWVEDVVSPFNQQIAGRYPMNRNASREVSLQAFDAFFKPGGTLDSFYTKNLKPFIEDNPDSIKDADGNLLIREDVLTAFQRAKRIRDAFFDGQGALNAEFTLTPMSLSNDQRRAIVSVDGQLLDYNHGGENTVPMIWPNTLRSLNESRVTLIPAQVNRSPRSIRTDGPWAWFHLIDHARVTGASERRVDLRFDVNGGQVTYRLNANQAPNPFTRPVLRGFALPNTLY
ncbi:type VI secretion system membrane subunit TssM [Larsenimonas suaedae]|uniref:Type VI secretion system membrane subunit TssM n=1 Tax=Larsenimonas suaedae TaxID=1851019 RepID=A0ABU1GVN5_9GAMM|nr:type VI secretion system membrane subunit TssM [Larsenimonas suaedae]MCM2973212.1 type VI secretion system membrane subunit TssM [Larsenimonas suaedae]MDR5896105.1 type VI secretion system membrane subunit TssM [Larsenimonas suaedae]